MNYVFCDIVGVLHDNYTLFKGVTEKLKFFRENGIKVVLLSNAPRRAFKAQEVLNSFGITKDYYYDIVTSGEVFFQKMKNAKANAYFIGFKKDLDYMEGSSVKLQEGNMKECDFAIISGFRNRGDGISTVMEDLQKMKELNMRAYCINPDLHVVKQDGTIDILCGGTIGEAYKKIGGELEYFGKPYANIYEYAYNMIGSPLKSEIIAIGDAMQTDIMGANNFGIKSILVNSGLHKNNLDLAKYTYKPNSIVKNFSEIDL